jgi:hypothetical protein
MRNSSIGQRISNPVDAVAHWTNFRSPPGKVKMSGLRLRRLCLAGYLSDNA